MTISLILTISHVLIKKQAFITNGEGCTATAKSWLLLSQAIYLLHLGCSQSQELPKAARTKCYLSLLLQIPSQHIPFPGCLWQSGIESHDQAPNISGVIQVVTLLSYFCACSLTTPKPENFGHPSHGQRDFRCDSWCLQALLGVGQHVNNSWFNVMG